MLAFAESYDPLWTARVDSIDGKPVQSEHSNKYSKHMVPV